MKKIRVLLLFLLLIAFGSCSPQQRVARLIAKYNLPTVTEYVTDTVITPQYVRTDTVTITGQPVTIIDSNFIVFMNPVNDTVYTVKTIVKSDTIIRKIPVTKYVAESEESVKLANGLYCIFGVFFLLVVALAALAFLKTK